MEIHESEVMKTRKIYNIENIYLYGSHGDIRLWGDAPSIKESSWLAFGWGFDPSDEIHNYDWAEWWEAEGEEAHQQFLERWDAARQRAIESQL